MKKELTETTRNELHQEIDTLIRRYMADGFNFKDICHAIQGAAILYFERYKNARFNSDAN